MSDVKIDVECCAEIYHPDQSYFLSKHTKVLEEIILVSRQAVASDVMRKWIPVYLNKNSLRQQKICWKNTENF